MPLDESISSIISDLASQSFDAKVIADRLGVSHPLIGPGSGDITASDSDAAGPSSQAIYVPSLLEQLREKINQLSETVLLLTLAASESGTKSPMTDEEAADFTTRFTSHLSKLAPIQIETFYNEMYFNKCPAHLRNTIVKALIREFTKRKLQPVELWTTFI